MKQQNRNSSLKGSLHFCKTCGRRTPSVFVGGRLKCLRCG